MWPAKSGKTPLLVLLFDRLLWLPGDGGAAPSVSDCFEVSIPHPEGSLKSLECALTSLAERLISTPETQDHRQWNALISDQWMICDILPWSDALMGVEAHPYVMESLSVAGYRVDLGDMLRVDDRIPGKPCWVACFPAILLEALRRFAEQARQPLNACSPIGPALCCFLARRMRIDGPIGVLEERWLRFYQVGRKTCQPIGCPLPVTDRETITLAWQRIQLAHAGILHTERFQLVSLAKNSIARTTGFPTLDHESQMHSGVEPIHRLAWLGKIDCEDHPLTYCPIQRGKHRYAKCIKIGLLAVLVGLLGWGLVEVEAEIDSRLEMTHAASQVPPRQASPSSVNVALAQSAITLLYFPFEESLRALIPQNGASVYLIGIDLDNEATPSMARIVGQCRTLDDIGTYMKELLANSRIDHVELLRHENVQDNSALPLRFELEITWQSWV